VACALTLKKNVRFITFFLLIKCIKRALVAESQGKESQESHRHHRPNTHTLEYNSDCSDHESKEVNAAEFVWPSQAKSFACSTLKSIHKN